jgi:hypothetical protein
MGFSDMLHCRQEHTHIAACRKAELWTFRKILLLLLLLLLLLCLCSWLL